ncbi:AMP-activated serine/threonine-protein kinase regulatory subunit [Dionaea muscipula]
MSLNYFFSYTQFKFNVDGEWRHDEHQDFVSGSYGIVNTVFLARDSEPLIPIVFTTETPGRFNMEVDDTFMRMGISDGISSEAAPTISATDIEVSRHRISLFLSQHTAYELLIESGKVVALDVNLPVKQAFHILYEQLGNHGSNLTEEELETYTILDWKDGKSHIIRQIDGDGGLYPRRLIHVRTYDSLKDVALKILQNKVSTVPVIHSSSPDGSYPQLLHLASLSGILKCEFSPIAK